MAKKISGIYKITNIKNNKIYIGQSSDIFWRWTHHKSDLNNNRHHNRHLQNAWNKYGKDNFVFSIIEQCPEDNLDEKESYWINYFDSYNNGYNLDYGGQGIRGYKHTDTELEKMHRIQNPKIVLQFDLNFNFVKEWIGGVSHINKELGYTKECILLRCQHTILNKMTPYKNSYWVYKEEYESENFNWNDYFLNVRIWNDIPIYQYDTKHNLIKIWNTHFELKEAGYKVTTILRICNHDGSQKMYKNSIWAFEGYDFSDDYFKYCDKDVKDTRNCKRVHMKKEKDGDIIKTFDSITEACLFLGRAKKFRGNIISSIKKNQRSGGYYWEYAN